MKIFSIDNSKYLLKLLPSYSDLFLDDTCAFLKNSLYLQQNYLLANSLPTYICMYWNCCNGKLSTNFVSLATKYFNPKSFTIMLKTITLFLMPKYPIQGFLECLFLTKL